MRICIFSPFFLCLDEHGFLFIFIQLQMKARRWKKPPTELREGWTLRDNFFNVARQRSPKLYLIKTVGPGACVLGTKSFSQQSYMKFSPHTDFVACGQWSLVCNSHAMKGTFCWLAFHYEY